MASLRRNRAMAADGSTPKFLYAILKQLDLKSIDWNEVAENLGISNGHAARMRFSRFKQQMEGIQPPPRKPRPAIARKKPGKEQPKPNIESGVQAEDMLLKRESMEAPKVVPDQSVGNSHDQAQLGRSAGIKAEGPNKFVQDYAGDMEWIPLELQRYPERERMVTKLETADSDFPEVLQVIKEEPRIKIERI